MYIHRFMLAMCCYLVKLGFFRKVKISFLPVGHTHCDVDASFSRFSVRLNTHNAETVDALMDEYEKSQAKARAVSIASVFNFKSWLEPVMSTLTNQSRLEQCE